MSNRYSLPKALFAFFFTCCAFFSTQLQAQRVTDQLQALYRFEEGSGSVVYDHAGSMHLTIGNTSNVNWIPGGGLSINSGTVLSSSGNATTLKSALQATNELTVEAWVAPANTTQDGPARIVTFSGDTGQRNFTLGQEDFDYGMRLRTDNGGSNNGQPDVYSSGSLVSAGTLQHVVFVRNSAGEEKIYVDGSEVYSGTRLGTFSNWADFQFALANELTNNRDWLGEIHLVAVYTKDLSAAEVTQNYNAGTNSATGDCDLRIRANGSCGGEILELWIDGSSVGSVTLTTTPTTYTYSSFMDGQQVQIVFNNDENNGCDYNMFVDYVQVDDDVYQTETEATRTGCGTAEWLNCNGNFDFGNLSCVLPSGPCGSGEFDYVNCENLTIEINRANLTPNTFIYTDDDYLGCISYVDGCTVLPGIAVYCADFNLTEPTPFQGYEYGEVTFTRVEGAVNAGYTALEGERMNWIVCNGEAQGYSRVEINRAIWYVTGTYNTCNTLCNSAITAVTASNLTGAEERVIVYQPDQAGIQPFLENSCATSCDVTATFSTVDAICGSAGSITVTAEGGTGNYEYRLNGGGWQSGDTFDNLTAGTYSIEVRNDNGTCETGPFSVTISDDNSGEVSGFQLDDTGGSNNISITDGDVFSLGSLPDNFRLEVLTTGTVGSVVIDITGTTTATQTENSAPYTYPGSGSWNAGVGTYTVTANIYNQSNGNGAICDTETITFQIVDGTDVPEPTDWNYSCEDGVVVDLIGSGPHDEQVTTISIPSSGNVFQYVVEIVYKGGNPGTEQDIEDDSGNFYTLQRSRPPGTSSNVYIYRGLILGTTSEITYRDFTNEDDLQSIVIYAFRNVGTANATTGTYTSRSGYHDTYTFNLTIPEDFTSRDIVIDLPISEVTLDCRILNITATAGTVTDFFQMSEPDTEYGPCCLAIPQLTLNDVPGNITTVTVEVESPTGSSNSCPVSANQNGQSYVIAGLVGLDLECIDCVGFDPGTISADQSNCGPFDPNEITGTAAVSDITVTYQWQSRMGTSGAWTDIPGATGQNYDPSTITTTTQYQRLATTGDCSDVASNIVTMTVFDTEPLVCESFHDGAWFVEEDCAVIICEGEYLALSVNPSGLASYVWSGPNGFSANTEDAVISNSVTPANTGTYSVTATDANGCVATTSIDVIILMDPDISIVADDASVCEGQSTTITASASGGIDCADILWQFREGTSGAWTDLTNLGNTLLTDASLSPGTYQYQTMYSCPGFGCDDATSNIVTLTVYAYPSITASADATELCSGNSATLTAAPTDGTSVYTYTWDNGLGAGASHVVTPTVTTTYTVTADNNGCTTDASVEIVVEDIITDYGTISGDQTNCGPFDPNEITGTPITTSGGNINPTYSWEYRVSGGSWTIITNSDTQNYDPGPITETTEYRRRADANNGCGNDVTNVVTMTVNPIPTITVDSDECNPENFFSTYDVVVTVTDADNLVASAGTLVDNGDGTYNINDIDVDTDLMLTATNTTTGCAVDIDVPAPFCFCPPINDPVVAVPDYTICDGDPFPTFTATIEPQTTLGTNTVDWYDAPSGGNLLQGGSLTFTPTAAGTYYAEGRNLLSSCLSDNRIPVTLTINPLPNPGITGDLEICEGQSTTLTAEGGVSYVWNTTETTAAITVNPAVTTTYTVTATDANGCSNTASVEVVVNPNPTAELVGDPLVCEGESTTLTASGAGAGGSYLWSTGATTADITVFPIGTETFTVTVTDANGCSDVTSITANDAPEPVVVATSVELCVGESTTLTASGGVSYQWDANGGNATTDAITVSPTETTTYAVTVTNAVGCSAEGTVTVTVLELPEITSTDVVQPTSCDGTDNGSITVNATGVSGVLQYRLNGGTWQFSNEFTGLGAGTYNVEVSYTGNRCPVGPVVVTLDPVTPPTVDAGDDQTICLGESATLSANGTGGTGVLTYTWDPIGETGATVTVTPTTTTTYTVTVEDELGCTSTDVVTVTVDAIPQVTTSVTNATCGQDNGTITFTFVDQNGRTNIEFSIDGGNTYPYNVADNTGSFTVTGLSAGVYDLWTRWGDDDCPVDLGDASIAQELGPVVTAAGTATICEGSTTTISATSTDGTGTITYTWMPGNLNGASVDVSPTTTTTYTVTATDENGCTSTDQVTITVDPAIVSGIDAVTSICAQEGVLFVANPAVSGATYAWSFSGPATPSTSTNASETVTYASAGTYTAILTVSRGQCIETYTHTITITDAVFADAGPGLTICQGESVQIGLPAGTGGPAGATYSWSPATFLDDPNIAQPTSSAPFTFNYTLTVTENGCVRTDQMTVTVNQLPTPSISGNLEICQGESTTLTATGGQTYAWSNGESGENITVNPAATTTYTVTATDANGCSNTASVTVVVNDNPVAVLEGNPLVCQGETTTLTASGAGAGGSYEWSTGATTASITVSPTSIETYTVTVTNANGCTDVTSITVNEAPDPTVVAASVELCEGQSTTLTASGGTNYQWDANGGNATTAEITVSPTVTTTYTVTVTSSVGCPAVADITVTVLELPEIVDVAVVQPTSCDGTENGSITVTATGASDDLQYRVNGGAWQASNVFNNLAAGTYNVEVSYIGARCLVGPTTVTLNEVVPPAVEASNDVSICLGESTTLTATGSGGTGNLTYTWMPGNLSGSEITVSPTVTTTYTVTVEDEFGCTSTDVVTVIILALPQATVSTTNPNCGSDNGTITFTFPDTDGRTTVQFSIDGGTSYPYTSPDDAGTFTVSGLAAGNYDLWVRWGETDCPVDLLDATLTQENGPIVTASADVTICEGSTTTLTASHTSGTGTVTYTWQPGNLSGTSVDVSPTTTTTYTVMATDANGCTSTDQVVVTVDPAFTSGINAVTSVCAQEGVLFVANPAVAGATYAWTFSGPATPTTSSNASETVTFASAGTYTATLTVTRGECEETYSHTITITDPVYADAGPDMTICQGESVQIGLPEGTGGPVGATYTWTPSTFLDNPNIAQPTSSAPFTFTYTLTVTQNGCVRTDQVTVNVNALPTPTISGIAEICAGESTTLTASGGTSYAWNTGENTASITVNPGATSTYTVTVTDGNSCSNTASQVVVVNPNPVASIVGDPVVCEDQTSTITASGAGAGGSYAWSTGENTASIEVSPTDIETYTVTVTDVNGCTDITSVTVTAAPDPVIVAASVELCEGQTTTLTVSGGVSYQWDANAGNATTASVDVTPATTTQYFVTVTSALGCTAVADVTITVLEQPEITSVDVVQPTSCTGTENGMITVNATGSSDVLQYRINGGTWQASNVFDELGAGTYNVEVSYVGERCVVGPSTVTLNTVTPPSVSASAAAPAICFGASTALTAVGSGGTGALTYSWSNGGSGAVITVTPTVTTTYIVTVVDELNCSSTADVTVTVNDNPVVSLNKTDATCGQDNGTITASVSGGQAPLTYTWSPNVSTTASASDLAVGTYTVTVTDTNGCTGTASIDIINLASPTITAAADQTICEGSAATLSATTTGG
ncbi:MAG: LamG-like jellyroll fold domain-containing protein, partial [Bacteroidota bacterium]